jgi:hypothetical protein
MLVDERERERKHVNKDMDRGDDADYLRAKEGMENNQRKDERQVVAMTRRLMAQRKSPGFMRRYFPASLVYFKKQRKNFSPNQKHLILLSLLNFLEKSMM